ncbi:MAG: hypothetical protein LBL30_01670 [Holosporales bacterium]|jgi:hypothetical protein|nr:hypothetical protein [Holosporales bacterium]
MSNIQALLLFSIIVSIADAFASFSPFASSDSDSDTTFMNLSPVAEWSSFSQQKTPESKTSNDVIGQTTRLLADLQRQSEPTDTQLLPCPVEKKHKNYGYGKEHYRAKAIAEERLKGRIICCTAAYAWFLEHYPGITMQNLKKNCKNGI